MEEKKLNKIEVNKIWDAMIEAEVITKPADRKEAKKQYNTKDELKTTNNYKIQLLKKTVLFFYDKYHNVRKIFYEKLNNKEKIIKELKVDNERLQKQNAALESNIKSLKETLLEESEANHKYKTANKVLNQKLNEKNDNVKNNDIEVKPEPERIDNYNNSCIVTSSGDSDDELPPDYYKKLQATLR